MTNQELDEKIKDIHDMRVWLKEAARGFNDMCLDKIIELNERRSTIMAEHGKVEKEQHRAPTHVHDTTK